MASLPFEVIAEPADAMTTQATAIHSVTDKYSCKNTKAASEAIAGSRLIRILKVRAGKCLRAFISSVKGMALESRASAAPKPIKCGLRLASRPSKIQKG